MHAAGSGDGDVYTLGEVDLATKEAAEGGSAVDLGQRSSWQGGVQSGKRALVLTGLYDDDRYLAVQLALQVRRCWTLRRHPGYRAGSQKTPFSIHK